MPHIIIRPTDYTVSPQLALLSIIQRVGGIVALPLVSYLTDGLGRRIAVFVGATTMVVGAVLQATSQNVGMFIGARYYVL